MGIYDPKIWFHLVPGYFRVLKIPIDTSIPKIEVFSIGHPPGESWQPTCHPNVFSVQKSLVKLPRCRFVHIRPYVSWFLLTVIVDFKWLPVFIHRSNNFL